MEQPGSSRSESMEAPKTNENADRVRKDIDAVNFSLELQNRLVDTLEANLRDFMAEPSHTQEEKDAEKKNFDAKMEGPEGYRTRLKALLARKAQLEKDLQTALAATEVKDAVGQETRTNAADASLMSNMMDRVKKSEAFKDKMPQINAAETKLKDTIVTVYQYLLAHNSPKTAELVLTKSYKYAQWAVLRAYSAGANPEETVQKVLQAYEVEINKIKSNTTYAKAFVAGAPKSNAGRKIEDILADIERNAKNGAPDLTASADSTLEGTLAATELGQNIDRRRTTLDKVRLTPVDNQDGLVIDMAALQNNPEFKEILQNIINKGSANQFLEFRNNIFTTIGDNADQSIERSILEGMGAKGKDVPVNAVTVIAGIYTTAMVLKEFSGWFQAAQNPALIGIEFGIAGVMAAWSLIVGDMRVWSTEVMVGMSADDLRLYMTYARLAQKAKTVEGNEDEMRQYAAKMQDISTLIRYRSAKAQHDTFNVSSAWGAKERTQELAAQLATIRNTDTGNIIPLYEEWDGLVRELSGKQASDEGFAEKYARLEQIEASLRERGISFTTLRDQMAKAAGTNIDMKTDQNRAGLASYADIYSPEQLRGILEQSGAPEYIKYIKENLSTYAGQASGFLERTVANLKAAGIEITLPEMTATTAEEKMAYVQSAIKQIEEQLKTFKENNQTLESLFAGVEKTMEGNAGPIWEAYSEVKEGLKQTPPITKEAAREKLQPFITKMAELVSTRNMAFSILTLGIWTNAASDKSNRNYQFRFSQDLPAQEQLNLLLEMYAASFEDAAMGEKAQTLYKLRTQNEAMKDLAQLSQTTTRMNENFEKQGRDAKSFENLMSGLEGSPESGLRAYLLSLKAKLDKINGTFTQVSANDMASIYSGQYRGGVSKLFTKFTEKTNEILRNPQYDLTKLSPALMDALPKYELATPDERRAIEQSLGVKAVSEALDKDMADWQKLVTDLRAELDELKQAQKDPVQLEMYHKLNAQASLRDREASAERGASSEKERYVNAKNAYRDAVTQVNELMATFYNVTPAQYRTMMEKKDAQSLTKAEKDALDLLVVLDEGAFADPQLGTSSGEAQTQENGQTVIDLLPTDPAVLAREAARFENMKLQSEAYLRLLNAIKTVAPLSKDQNRDREIVNTLIDQGLLIKNPEYYRNNHQTRAFGYLGLLTKDLVADSAYKVLGTTPDKMSKEQIAQLLNTLVLLGGERGKFAKAPEQYETYADTLRYTLANLQNFRSKMVGMPTDTKGYNEARLVNDLMQESDAFQLLRTMHPIDANAKGVPTKFVNLGVGVQGAPLILDRNNRDNVFQGEMYKDVDGIQLRMTVYMKKQCMNIQVPVEQTVAYMKQLVYRAQVPKQKLERAGLATPEANANASAVHEAGQYYMLMRENNINLSPILMAALALIPGFIQPEDAPRKITEDHTPTELPPQPKNTEDTTGKLPGPTGDGIPQRKILEDYDRRGL